MKSLTTSIRITLIVAVTAAAVASPGLVFAQGTIFGTVQNADLTSPAAGEVFWFGFLDNTDEEIRIEANVGAGFDGSNWFDDFQNYTTEGAGNPYDFVFTNVGNGEAFRLEKTIPDNSFQQENIVLTTQSFPLRPTGITATVLSPTSIQLVWDAQPGSAYHIYRRVTTNNSVFRRIDDPSGDISNPGVTDSVFVDATSDGTSQYTYLIIAENALGNYSAHSEPIDIDASGLPCACDCHGDPQCDSAINVFDVVMAVEVGLRNGTPVPDPNPGCPYETTDTDCTGTTNVFDVVRLVDVAFRSAAADTTFCDPCVP